MGWESGAAAGKLFDKIRDHYHRYSGIYGFPDETDGEGRFDRYSVLLAGEIAHHFIESGGSPPAEARGWVRKTSPVMLPRMHSGGGGILDRRSPGPLGGTAVIADL